MISKFCIFVLFLVFREAAAQIPSFCHRDYSLHCAEGWTQLINVEECVAPLSYTGPCARLLQVEHDTKKKKLIERECNIAWPCLVQCKKDMTAQCPQDWVAEDEKMCRPLATYSGTCLLPHDFSNMTDEQKEIWSNKCETSWPCKEKCKKDYTKSCPQAWKRDNNGLCVAPKSYNGPCLSKASLFSLDKSMKVAFEKLCKAEFPCQRTCDLDPEAPCPKRWILQSDSYGNMESCIPPIDYRGHCGRGNEFFDLSLELKEEKANECDIEWPCSEETYSQINYDELCPEGWTQYEEYCVAPQNYEGPCMKKKMFGSFTKDVKREYEDDCNVQWPLFKDKKGISKGSALRKGRSAYGAVEPLTGEVVSIV